MDFIVKFFLTIRRSLGMLFVEGNFRFAAQWRTKRAVDESQTEAKSPERDDRSTERSRGEERVVMQVQKTFSSQSATPLDKLLYPKRFVNFHTATLDMEGNVQLENSKSDPGGSTAWGISSKANPDLSQEISQGMTRDRGYQIAFERYYSVIPNIGLMEPRIAFVVYDSRFHGMKENLLIIESSLKRLGYNIVDDGKFEQETYRVLSNLTAPEADVVMNDLNRSLKLAAASAAKRTMKAQEAQGLPIHDYTDGFINRQTKRLKYAQSFRSLDTNV